MGERNGAVVSKHALRGNNIFPKNAPVGRAAKLGSSIRATNIQPPTPVGTHLGRYKLRVSDHEWKCVPPCSVDDSAELPYINAKMQTKKLVPHFSRYVNRAASKAHFRSSYDADLFPSTGALNLT